MIEIEFLGSGTSTGVPQIGCHCEVCMSPHERDKRLRASAIVRYQGKCLLIDCGPDFRTQMLRASNQSLDALLVTHIHYDHVAGMDDLRAYCHAGPFPVYVRPDVIDNLRKHMPYCFARHPYPGVPSLDLRPIGDDPFLAAGIEVVPISVMHASMPIVGFRIGPMAYITDAKTIPPESMARLKGVKLLVMNALRIEPHHSHMCLAESLRVVKQINPEVTYFTHMSHGMGRHDDIERQLPSGVHLSYDGLVVTI